MGMSVWCPHCDYRGDFTRENKDIILLNSIGVIMFCASIIFAIIGFLENFILIFFSPAAFLIAVLSIRVANHSASCPKCGHKNIVRERNK